MGIYSDLQTDLAEAFDNDLSDAVVGVVFSVETVGSYNPATGSVASTKTTYTTRCVVIKDVMGQDPDEPARRDEVHILVLDSEKVVSSFIIGMGVLVRGENYEISGAAIDPVSATHTLVCRIKR